MSALTQFNLLVTMPMHDLTVRNRKTEVHVLKFCKSDRRAQMNSAGAYKYKSHSAWSTQQLY